MSEKKFQFCLKIAESAFQVFVYGLVGEIACFVQQNISFVFPSFVISVIKKDLTARYLKLSKAIQKHSENPNDLDKLSPELLLEVAMNLAMQNTILCQINKLSTDQTEIALSMAQYLEGDDMTNIDPQGLIH